MRIGKVIKKTAIAVGIAVAAVLMKIIASLVGILIIGVGMFGFCVIRDWDKYGVETTLWGCDDKVYYTSGGFQDYIDYGEYYFNEKSIKKFERSGWYSIVEEDDIELIQSYFEYFESWLNQLDYKDEYSFDKDTQIDAGDYYFIYNRYDDEPYYNYDVYYVDIDSKTVYFIHLNI